MTAHLKTPPHRENRDWYQVKFRLASTLSNQAFAARTKYEPAGTEVDDLLAAIWTTLDLEALRARQSKWRLRFWRRRDNELQRSLEGAIEPAALILKATVAAGIASGTGRDEGLELDAVRSKLREGEDPTPLTIIQAIVRRTKADSGTISLTLLTDLACFFQVSGQEDQARHYLNEALDTVPPRQLARFQVRVAADPMLGTIELPAAPSAASKRRCKFLGRKAAPPDKPKRPWG